jgi:hypothetical protein
MREQPMTESTDLQQALNECFNSQLAPSELADKLLQLFQEACSPGKQWDSGGVNWKVGAGAYEFATAKLLSLRFYTIADALLQDWWRSLSYRQYAERKWLPYAIPTYLLSQVFFAVGDLGVAFRWTLLTYAHDILSNQPVGYAHQVLHATFGMNKYDIKALDEVGHECRRDIEGNRKDWGRLNGFPEEVLRRFATEKRSNSYASQIAHLTTQRDFPVSPGYLSTLVEQLDSGTNDQKGRSLEDTAFYLMSLLPGCLPKRNVLDSDRAYETDLIVRNLQTNSNIISDLFGRHILVECKNYAKPVGVPDVGYFLFRMRLTHAIFGVIFAPKGITGKQEAEARSLVRRAFHEDATVCIIIDRNDLQALAAGDMSLYWLLLEKYEEFRFGKPKQAKSK